ncbi:hypothetical protein NLU13_9711 [Sarocladium strictum]|uniref:DUF676 domain-containing protein n=1 Tax=Sarocladium strictum TaxID=5046 RepID=A0AA39GAL9_SARSR|nr:hypothetical protein NLU13_9711 [Sarocladium strictum]
MVGTYNKGPGLTSRGIVVSRGPVPPGTPDAVPPKMTTTAILKLHATTSKRTDLYDMRKHSMPVSRSPPIEYLHSFLAPKQEKWERLDIQHLKRCSRKRDLPPSWVRHHSKGLICPNIYAFSLAYLVGDEVTDPSEKCTAPRMSTARLSDRCIRLPAGLSKDARSEFSKVSTCVGCRYWCFVQRRRNHCSWSHEPQDSAASEAGAESNDLERTSLSRGSTDGESPARYSDSSAPQPTEPAVPPGSGLRHSRSLTMAPVEELSGNQLEMEDWEFAPGRLMTRQEPAQNVAFSNSYLTSREPVVISDDISFNVAILSSGSTVHFSVEESKIRTCSVAAGKVKVKIGTTDDGENLSDIFRFVSHPVLDAKLASTNMTSKLPTPPIGRGATTDLDSLLVSPGSLRSVHPTSPSANADAKSQIPQDASTISLLHEQPVAITNGPQRFTLDPDGVGTHDETTVDIVTIPCPGGHALRTWNRDGLISRFFGAPSMRDAEVDGTDAPGLSWVRQGIRREANRARIALYEHPEAAGGTTLSTLADALLQDLEALRRQENAERPLLFVCHSIGGLVAKMALVKAGNDHKYRSILRDCYGVAFFGTPHQGSSYFAMPSLASSVQRLLQLSNPLPTSITDDLRVGNGLIIQADDDFKAISTDMRIWTFYETIDSRLSGNGSGDVFFTAPLTSIKSAILGMRQERIFPLQSDHANIASFGRHNVHTLKVFLNQLAVQINRADRNVRELVATESLDLEQRVSVEVHGFFEDPVDQNTSGAAVIRAWSTRLPLKDFLHKGPDVCLSERLSEVEESPQTWSNPLGIQQPGDIALSPPVSPVLRPVDAPKGHRPESAPEIPLGPRTTSPSMRPVLPLTRHSSPMRRPSPLIRADFEQDLAIDRLSPPMRPQGFRSASRSHSDGSQFEYRDFPPFSQRSHSHDAMGLSDTDKENDEIDPSPPLPEAVVAIRKVVKDGKRRPSGTVIVDEVPVAFKKPEVRDRKFIWIHVPHNNPTWVKRVFGTLQETYRQDYSSLYNNDFWATKHTRGRHGQHYAFHAKPGCYYTGVRAPSRAHSMRSRSFSPTPPMGEASNTCVFLPYLHFDTYKRLVRRREFILRRLQHGRAHPVPESVVKSDSVELQVIWEYLGHDPPLNLRRTLDQYGYPSLQDTRSRDDDQMLYKLTKERLCNTEGQASFYGQGSSSRSAADSRGGSKPASVASGKKEENGKHDDVDILNGNVLMVDQLWLWALGSHTILTLFPKRHSDPIEGPLFQQADLRDSIFNEINVDMTRQCENALDLAALAALHAVSVLLDRSSHPNLEIFRIFEEAISVLTEKLTSSLKAFRTEGFRDKASAYEPVENKERSIRARHKAEGERAEQENRDNTSAVLELRDIEDELLILLHLFERQSKVISSMHSTYLRPELRELTINGRAFLTEAMKKINEYIHQADEMIQRVRNTRDDYDKLLQMVQRQAQVDEVRLSRLHADLASAQSRSVMIFTTFTVIFLPLTFFTGLFGMNTQEWGGEGNLSLKTIGAISLPSSFVLIVASLFVAWSTTVRRFFRWTSRVYTRQARWCYFEIARPVGRKIGAFARTGKANGRRQGENDDGRVKREASDFWQRHRLEREKGYEIPVVNRKSPTRLRSGGRGKASSSK